MYRTITSATLLITSAVVCLTGCVSVTPPVRPGAQGEPQIVQAPAHEALERLMRSRTASVKAHRPARKNTAARRAHPPYPVSPRIPLPRLPVVPQPPGVQAAQPPRTAPRQRDTCTLRRDFDRWQPNGRRMSLC